MTKELTALAPSTMKIKVVALQSGSIRSGSEGRSSHPCQLSNRCGYRRGNTMNRVRRLCTASVSEGSLPLILICMEFGACRMDHSNVHACDAVTCWTVLFFVFLLHMGFRVTSGLEKK